MKSNELKRVESVVSTDIRRRSGALLQGRPILLGTNESKFEKAKDKRARVQSAHPDRGPC
jgi:hypothetical protein